MTQQSETDSQLMARLCQGDDSALDLLIHRHRAAAEQYARVLLQDAGAAEEAVMDAFARVYLLRERYQPAFAFQIWLRVLVRSRCLDQLRRRARQPIPVDDPVPQGLAASPEALALQKEERLRLWEMLEELSEVDQRLLLGYAMEGRSYRELADALHLSLPQVRVRLHRIRKRLRRKEDAAE
ncbi:MAG TPA: RNA polymerase sigma factor [Candidatus Egerieenecus merdigallinarum]|nr:RNA polymerase sigma factor [Candidatus Egerieenecus merdigallinarum]